MNLKEIILFTCASDWYFLQLQYNTQQHKMHCKKMIFPARESLVSDGKTANVFYSVHMHFVYTEAVSDVITSLKLYNLQSISGIN